MSRTPRNKSVAATIVTVRLTRAEAKVLKDAALRHESLGQVLRRLALTAAAPTPA